MSGRPCGPYGLLLKPRFAHSTYETRRLEEIAIGREPIDLGPSAVTNLLVDEVHELGNPIPRARANASVRRLSNWPFRTLQLEHATPRSEYLDLTEDRARRFKH